MQLIFLHRRERRGNVATLPPPPHGSAVENSLKDVNTIRVLAFESPCPHHHPLYEVKLYVACVGSYLAGCSPLTCGYN